MMSRLDTAITELKGAIWSAHRHNDTVQIESKLEEFAEALKAEVLDEIQVCHCESCSDYRNGAYD